MDLLDSAPATLGLAALITAAVAGVGMLRIQDPASRVVVTAVLFYAMTTLCGYALGALGCLGSPRAWLAAGALMVVSTASIRRYWGMPAVPAAATSSDEPAARCSRWLYPGLAAGFAAVAGIVLVHLAIAVRVAPHTWDVMVYHLTRMAYFLQHGSLAWYPANYWSQIQHAKNSAILDGLVYLASFRHDSFIQAIQLGAYLVSGTAACAIARGTGASRAASLVAALFFLLSINTVLESSTAQNDLLLTACLSAGLLFWLRYIREERAAWLLMSATAIGLALGTKASALGILPSLGALGVAAYLQHSHVRPDTAMPARRRAVAGLACIGLIGLFSLPAGYADNFFRYGHPLGDLQVRTEHTFHGQTLSNVAHETVLNAARLTADLLRPDALPARPLAQRIQARIQSGLRGFLSALGFELPAPTHVPFGLGIETLQPVLPKEWSFVGMHEDWSFIGPLNLLLLVPAAIAGVAVCRRLPLFWGSLAAGVLLVTVMAARPYQPFLGRFFTIFPVLLAPALALVVDRMAGRRLSAVWISAALMIGAASAAHAVRHRSISPFPEVLALSRIEQLTRQNPPLRQAVERFEQRVAPNAAVIVVLQGDSYEYPFFGEGLRRTLIPGGAWPSLSPFPGTPEPQFLLYNAKVQRLDCDLDLGAGYRLRDLTRCRP